MDLVLEAEAVSIVFSSEGEISSVSIYSICKLYIFIWLLFGGILVVFGGIIFIRIEAVDLIGGFICEGGFSAGFMISGHLHPNLLRLCK